MSILKKGSVKIAGDITLDDQTKNFLKKKGKGYWFAIDSGAIEMNANKIIVLAD